MDLIPKKKSGEIGGSLSPIKAKGAGFPLDKFLRLGTLAAIVLIVVSLIFWAGFKVYEGYSSKKIKELQSEQAAIFSAADRQEAERIVALENNAVALQALLKNHLYVSEFFNWISKYTLPRVQWTSCAFNSRNGKASLAGEAGDYSTLAKQLLSFSSGEMGFKNIKTSNINLGRTGSVNFEMSFEVDSKKLQK